MVIDKTWTNLRISMLLTGSELIDGRLRDSNSFFVTKFLFERGQRLERIMVCDDRNEAIVDSLRVLAERSDVIITSGGLGPTSGDKTREAISEFLGLGLKLDKESLDRIKKFFRDRNRKYESNNDKQALIPETGRVLHNQLGTAACFSVPFDKVEGDKGILFALPGVPRELENLIPGQVMPGIAEHFQLGSLQTLPPALYQLRIFGLGESNIGARVVESLPESDVEVSYRASFPEVQVLFRSKDFNVSQSSVELAAQRAVSKIGDAFVFSNGKNQSIAEVVHNLLRERKETIAFAESCSGGMLGSLVTEQAGSSEYFLGSIVTYSNELKTALLGVPAKLIAKHGAVCPEVAYAMASGAKDRTGAYITVSITGIAGPEGGSDQKPVGTCFLAIVDEQGSLGCKIFFPGSRDRVRQYVSYAALELIRRRLLGIEICGPVFEEVKVYASEMQELNNL